MSEPGSCSFSREISKSEPGSLCCESPEGRSSSDLSRETVGCDFCFIRSLPGSESSFRRVEEKSAAGSEAGRMKTSKSKKIRGMIRSFFGSGALLNRSNPGTGSQHCIKIF